MDTELLKRLEEAAEQYQLKYETTERVAFTHGAVWMFKEAIALAKGCLEGKMYNDKYWGRDDEGPFLDADELLADFESDMNKLWEEQK